MGRAKPREQETELPIGHGGTMGGSAKEQLRSIIERVERVEEEKKATQDDIKDVYAEAKGNGFYVKVLCTIVRLRKMDTDERREQEAILETYMHALGMLGPDFARLVVESKTAEKGACDGGL